MMTLRFDSPTKLAQPRVALPDFLTRSGTAVSPPEPAQSSMRAQAREDDGEDRPRDPRDEVEKKGMGTGIIVAIVAGVVCVSGCCVLSVVGLLTFLLILPATQKVREAAARTQSTNNLKMIGLACHSFADNNKRLPFNGSNTPVAGVQYAVTATGSSATSGSWAFQILPYMDQGPVWETVDRNVEIAAYMCPGRGRPKRETSNGGGAWTDYFLNGYLNDVKGMPDAPDSKRTLVGINDGTSNTILVGHGNINTAQYQSNSNVALSTNIFKGGTTGTMRSGGEGWQNPPGVTLQSDSSNAPGIGSWGGPFPQGAFMGMADGTVRMFPYSTVQFSAFLTPNGGEMVHLPDF